VSLIVVFFSVAILYIYHAIEPVAVNVYILYPPAVVTVGEPVVDVASEYASG
jgi:hypothetical protein